MILEVQTKTEKIATIEDARPAIDAPANSHPVAFGLFVKIRNSPTSASDIPDTVIVPIPSTGKKICM
jgi:hypothetical protein